MGINIFYFIMSVYGWINWNRLFKRNEGFKVIRLSFNQNIFFFFITLFFWMIIFFILKNYTNSNVPIIDSFTTAFFITGMILMTIKSIENWLYLLVGNLVVIPLFVYKELYISAVFYLILTFFAFLGLISWKKSIKNKV
jgi:nicotinamide mononucleotide transporter